jgi:hypothetical protein
MVEAVKLQEVLWYESNQLSPLRQLCRLIKTPATDLTDLTDLTVTTALNTNYNFHAPWRPAGL